MLQQHREVGQSTLRFADFGQHVAAGTPQVEGSTVERHVVGVPRNHQAPIAGGVTPQHPVLHPALLVGSAGRWPALCHPAGFANTELLARGVELCSLLVVEAVVFAATVGGRDTFRSAQDEADVAEAALDARG